MWRSFGEQPRIWIINQLEFEFCQDKVAADALEVC